MSNTPQEFPQHLLSSLYLPDDEPCEFATFNLQDVEELCALEKTLNSSPWSAENFRSSLSQQHLCLGVRLAQTWIAYAVCSHVLDEAELLIIGVHKDHQGRGVGKALLLGLLEILRATVRSVFLEVRASNETAISLYHSAGFNCIGQRPGYYPPLGNNKKSEDALIFALEFVD